MVSGAAFLAGLSLARDTEAALEQILSGREFLDESLEEGISRLRRDVYERDNERFFVYVKKGQITGWLNIEDTMSLDMGKSIDLLPILEDAGIEEMHFLHTHPVAILEADKLLPPDVIREMRKTKKSSFPLIPSSQDIATLAKQKRFLAERDLPQRLTHSVLDPAGLWKYDVDLAHQAMKDISISRKPMKDGERVSDEELLVMSPEESAQFRLGLELVHQQGRFYEDGIGVTEKRLEELLRWAKAQWGVSLEFSPHTRQ
ncbi:MAG: hypothetical protein A3D65_04945 [Candidatus Lloydbacteria bacterium RIFCSPHIGHO2_02_FULL_50_13]|uniref:Uncharacterized protein n=1 Tax=Candidatus Lloydbacteria bacterium RIFCSPHIGHO2_02_FULL_50_13 TaxID=1798661 RepID=A0A1G2D4R3_9BACT|nr:MAG: hypothetical protein A3D65_04945 [Candidatus Lloydbacteria bacterium RIFCSPHIGHO2_02_FULL_50_13]